MEYVPGGSITSVLQKFGTSSPLSSLSLSLSVSICVYVCLCKRLFPSESWCHWRCQLSLLRSGAGVFSEPVIQVYTKQILHGLEYLHRHKIVHRDIKVLLSLCVCSRTSVAAALPVRVRVPVPVLAPAPVPVHISRFPPAGPVP
jgi:serine/threonine protein kinase